MAQFNNIRFQPSRPLLKEVSAERLNAIVAEIKKNRVRGERGITVRSTGDGTYVGLAASLRSRAAATAQPWDLKATQNPNNPSQYTVTVVPGTINGVLPSNWSSDFTCNSTGVYYAKAVLATDGENITGVTIEINTSAPTQQEPQPYAIASEVEYLFGLFSAGQVYRTIGSGHITLAPKIWLVTEKASPPAAGESPYVITYALVDATQ